MRDLNEDLDDQFREAVDRYTLRPVDSKWDELSGKIISVKRPSSIADPIRSKYRRWTIWLVLLILLPVAFVTVMPGFNGFHKTNANDASAAVQKNTTENVNQHSAETSKPDTQDQDPEIIPTQGQQTISSAQGQSAAPATAQTISPSQAQSVVSNETVSNRRTVQDNHAGIDPARKEEGLGAFDFGSSSFFKTSTKPVAVGLAASDALQFAPVYAKTGTSTFEKGAVPLTLNSNKNLPLQHMDIPRRQGFYLGIVGGPMLTQVKNQGLKKSGFDLGLLAGYTLSKKFSIETGVLYTHQYYFVSGKYYNEFAGTNYAASLEGSRNAFEVPLTLKYNLIRRAGGNFFIAAGASTFVGVNDKVLIHVADGAVPPSVHFDYGVTSYLPSYVNISLGYEYKIGKSADIRIEPYFQIPLNSNTGNSFKTTSSGGSIQVFNTGIHIGISRFIR